MSDAQHTAGPWTATWTHDTRCAIHSGAWMSQGVIAVVHAAGNDGDFSKETAEHNARLIAAAPDMLAFCRDLVTFIDDDQRAGIQLPSWLLAVARRTDGAIAKATGP